MGKRCANFDVGPWLLPRIEPDRRSEKPRFVFTGREDGLTPDQQSKPALLDLDIEVHLSAVVAVVIEKRSARTVTS